MLVDDLKGRLNEDNTRDKLFHPRMRALGYPRAGDLGATQYDQQGHVGRGRFDGCYLLDGRPVVLVELKREGLLADPQQLARARAQVHGYALSGDFEVPPPLLLVSDGRSFEMYERTSMDAARPLYEPLARVLAWDEVGRRAPGRYSPTFVDLANLIRLFRTYADRIEEEVRPQVLRIAEAAAKGASGVVVGGRRFGRAALSEVGALFDEKTEAVVGGDAKERRAKAVHELAAAGALNYVNKVFFLKYCEDRHVEGLFRILSELDIDPVRRPQAAAYAAAYAALLKRRASCADGWPAEAEAAYRELIAELKAGVLDKRSWFELVHAAFLVAEQSFPVIYKATPYDHLFPTDDTIVDMLCDLRAMDFGVLDHEMVGSIYQGILRNKQYRQKVLGSFYTPPKTVEYMVSRLGIERGSVALEPACGSGHFVEALYREYLRVWEAGGYSEVEAAPAILNQIVAFDIDDFAAQLAAMRLFFLRGDPNGTVPNIFVRDTLDMVVGRSGTQSFLDADGRTIFDEFEGLDPRQKLQRPQELDAVRFNHVVGNPPYGGKPTPARLRAYQRLYRHAPGVCGHQLSSNDTFGFFVANAIERTAEGGTICLLISDSALSITSHGELRRLILNTCKIREIVLAPVDLFHPVAIPRTCVLTLQRASGDTNAQARDANVMRLVDRLKTEDDYLAPPHGRVECRTQGDYWRVPRNPFYVCVHDDVLSLFERCKLTVGSFVDGGSGLQTNDNVRFTALLAGSPEAVQQERSLAAREAKGQPPPTRAYRVVSPDDVVDFTRTPAPGPEQGFRDHEPHYVPFVRGSSRHQYVAPADRYLDYSESAIRHYLGPKGAGMSNRAFYFRRGLITNAHNRMLRATLVENSVPAINTNLFVPSGPYPVEYLLGLLNSRLATYLCTKILNTSIGGLSAHPTPEDIRLIPFAEPSKQQVAEVVEAVARIISAKQADPSATCLGEQALVDKAIYSVYGLAAGAVQTVETYWAEILEEQVGEPAEEGDDSD